MSQKIIPVGNRILAIPIKAEDNSEVVDPATKEKKRPERGEVVALGKDYKGEIKEGDVVLWEKFEVVELDEKGKKYYVGFPESFHLIIRK